LSNPARTRAIAEAKIRSDRLDASTLADLLRAGLVAESFVPPKRVREVGALLRYRVCLVRERTRVKNRVHALLDKHEVGVGFTDLFGVCGRSWLRGLKLSGKDGLVFRLALDEIDRLDGLIDEVSRVVAGEAVEDPWVELLLGFRGVDYYTAMVVLYKVSCLYLLCAEA
jgi:transposase